MADGGPAALLTHEHHEVDETLEDFVASVPHGDGSISSVLEALESMRRHIYLEEALLFPPLAAGGLVMPIAVMIREHGQLWRTMDALTTLLTGDDDAQTRQQAGELCQTLLAQLDGHNVKEEQIVYSSAETMLSVEQRTELADAIEHGSRPEGWVCQDAGAGV